MTYSLKEKTCSVFLPSTEEPEEIVKELGLSANEIVPLAKNVFVIGLPSRVESIDSKNDQKPWKMIKSIS